MKQSLEPESRAYGARILADPHGLRVGEPIPGSRYVRGVCSSCGEPIRVNQISEADLCRDCAGARIPPDTGHKAMWLSDRMYHGREYPR